MVPIVVNRPVWYLAGGAAFFDSVAAGEAMHHRPCDALGTYLIEPNGWLVHLFDTPVTALPAEANV